MRPVSLFIALILWCTTSHAQAPVYRLVNSAYVWYDGTNLTPKYFKEFKYIGNRDGVVTDVQSMIDNWDIDDVIYEHIKYDSSKTFADSTRTALKIREAKAFDNNDRLLYKWQNKQSTITYDTVTYNGNNIDSIKTVTNTNRTIKKYNSLGRLEKATFYSVSMVFPVSTTTYIYNIQGNLVEEFFTSQMLDTQKIIHTYDGSNRRTTTLSFYNVPAPTDTTYQTIYTYNANGTRDTTWYNVRNGITGMIENRFVEINYYTGNTIDSVVRYGWNNVDAIYKPYSQTYFSYNSYGFVSLANQKGAIGTGGAYKTFNYEYAWPLSVGKSLAANEILTIYPSPAHNTITIQTTFPQPQTIAATITDMQGRVLRTWNEPSTKEYKRTIPVADLPAGNYVLKLNDRVKQFVVQ